MARQLEEDERQRERDRQQAIMDQHREAAERAAREQREADEARYRQQRLEQQQAAAARHAETARREALPEQDASASLSIRLEAFSSAMSSSGANLDNSGKIVLPSTVLENLIDQRVALPYFFRIEGTQPDAVAYATVQDFDAPVGIALVLTGLIPFSVFLIYTRSYVLSSALISNFPLLLSPIT